MDPYAASASLVTCILLTAVTPTIPAQTGDPHQRLPLAKTVPGVPARPRAGPTGCGVQYEPRNELTQVCDLRVQALFRRLLVRAGISEEVLLCGDIPLEQKNFAETIRRSDGRAIVTMSSLLLQFNDEEVSGMLAHELAHLLAGDPERPRAATRDEYLREERDADIRATKIVGREAMCAAVRRAFQTSIALGFQSNTRALQWYRDLRLRWIMEGAR